MYADLEYYEQEYLLGKNAVIPEEEFAFYEKKAGMEINRHTFDRISRNKELVTDMVRDCACEIAELLYKADALRTQASENGLAGVVSAYSNDGESATINLESSVYTEDGKKKEIKRLVDLYLGNTGLLYRGVR